MTIGIFNHADRQTARIAEICHISSQFLLALIIPIGLSTTTFAQADRFLFDPSKNHANQHQSPNAYMFQKLSVDYPSANNFVL